MCFKCMHSPLCLLIESNKLAFDFELKRHFGDAGWAIFTYQKGMLSACRDADKSRTSIKHPLILTAE